jgi:prepilin-type N-terminal cleavage/methylation domain-containing protein
MSAYSRKAHRGVTLIELLVVIAIIVLLATLIGLVAPKMRERAFMADTKARIKDAHLAMDEYRAIWRTYPAGAWDTSNVTAISAEVYPEITAGKVDPAGVLLDHRLMSERDPGHAFKRRAWEKGVPPGWNDELGRATDPDGEYLVDAWGTPLFYRKSGPLRILIWSAGPPIRGTADSAKTKVADEHKLTKGDIKTVRSHQGRVYTDETGADPKRRDKVGNDLSTKDMDF